MQLADTSLHTTNSTLTFLADESRSVHVNVMLASNRNGGWRHSHVDVTAGTGPSHDTPLTSDHNHGLGYQYDTERGYAVQVSRSNQIDAKSSQV